MFSCEGIKEIASQGLQAFVSITVQLEEISLEGSEAAKVVDAYSKGRNRLREWFQDGLDQLRTWIEKQERMFDGDDVPLLAPLPALIAIVVVKAGCSADQVPPSPTPTSTVETPRPTSAPVVTRALAPPVADQCAVVPVESLRDLGVSSAGEPFGFAKDSLYRVWPGSPGFVLLSVRFDAVGDPLAAAYAESMKKTHPGGDQRWWMLFEPITVRGQPAVKRSPSADGARLCEVVVGLGQGKGVVVHTGADLGADDSVPQCPCAVEVAESVVGGLAP
ncbi:Protein of unknown function [Actinokineospora iranica]|uniref:Uncharacterized protein n=2 Tax=Actinokineospora iranica TaxID=1271860 RepID=A0A1G6LIX2_9PSEU|nr:Protein of unknown function [Actinokineospora iranica]